jgi:hypothetical protein
MTADRDDPLDGEFPVPDDVAPVVDRVRESIETEILPFEREHAEHLGDPLSYFDEEGRLTPEVHELLSEIQSATGGWCRTSPSRPTARWRSSRGRRSPTRSSTGSRRSPA